MLARVSVWSWEKRARCCVHGAVCEVPSPYFFLSQGAVSLPVKGGPSTHVGSAGSIPRCRGAAPKLSVLPQNAHGSARGTAWSGRSARCCREQAACGRSRSALWWLTHAINPGHARTLPRHSSAKVCGARGELRWAARSGRAEVEEFVPCSGGCGDVC